jgi:hypothetical protein
MSGDIRKSVEKIQVSLKRDEITGTVPECRSTFMTAPRLIFVRMRNVSDKFVEKIKTIYVQ